MFTVKASLVHVHLHSQVKHAMTRMSVQITRVKMVQGAQTNQAVDIHASAIQALPVIIVKFAMPACPTRVITVANVNPLVSLVASDVFARPDS